MTALGPFLLGVIAAFAAAIALVFFKFWRQTRDRLFLFFGAAFSTMAVERTLHGVWAAAREDGYLVYVVRLVAFVLILLGILDKNRSRPK